MNEFDGEITLDAKKKLKKAFEEKIGIDIITEDDCILIIEYLKKQEPILIKLKHKAEKKTSSDNKLLKDPISAKTLKYILLEDESLKFDINTINDLARGLGYRSYEDFLNNYLSNSELKDLIHPDDFMNEDIKKGDVFFVGTASVYVKLECMEDYFKFRILRGYNITRKTGIFHATDCKSSA